MKFGTLKVMIFTCRDGRELEKTRKKFKPDSSQGLGVKLQLYSYILVFLASTQSLITSSNSYLL